MLKIKDNSIFQKDLLTDSLFYLMKQYSITNVQTFYAPDYDGGIPWDDKDVNIEWPIEGLEILLSEKDKNHKPLKEQDLPFEY